MGDSGFKEKFRGKIDFGWIKSFNLAKTHYFNGFMARLRYETNGGGWALFGDGLKL